MSLYENDLKKCVETLNNGGVILYPTDTIWGLGCDATNQKAVKRIFEIKRRNESKSLIILVSDIQMLSDYIEKIPQKAIDLIEKTEKPLTIIYEGAKSLAKSVMADDGTVAVRIPDDNFCKDLINLLGKPLVSTSANFAGDSPPANFQQINKELLGLVDYVVNYRQDDFSVATPSTIVKFSGESLIYLRK